MILISHRGNIDGPNPERENTVKYVNEAIAAGYDVEIDVYMKDGRLWMGHDGPDEFMEAQWIADNVNKLWIHCKDLESLLFLRFFGSTVRYFGHSDDPFVLTSKGDLFCLPADNLDMHCILVMPEHFDFEVKPDARLAGILTDYPKRYEENDG